MAVGKIRSGWRPNAVVGRVVPILLLIYLLLAYHLVIVQYDTRRLYHQQGRPIAALVHAVACHALLLPPLWAYLRVFFSYSATSTQGYAYLDQHLTIGAVNFEPPIEPPAALLEKHMIFECDSKGDPLRCYRDNCNGKWKPARTRHCGDCRRCRVALDHHCPWFDADITAPYTLISFLLFLAFIPPLLLVAFSPLVALSYSHIAYIWKIASSSEEVRRVWWSKKKSWIGGPMYRWLIGLYLGSRHDRSSAQGTNIFDSANLNLPIMTFLALALILIASALFATTVRQLIAGDLTIDTRVRKLLAKHMSVGDRLKWQRYFWVPLPGKAEGGAVVALAANEQPYDLGSWKENMRAFLCLSPYTLEQLQLQWPISEKVKVSLIARADEQLRKKE